MFKKIKNWFHKSEDEFDIHISIPEKETSKFVLKVDGIDIAFLFCENHDWYFKYTSDFKKRSEEYNHIVGFPDLDKTYKSQILWPFFQIRIPGLKQPAIQEILAKESIDQKNEAALLKRFGHKTISNPYELLPA